MEPIEILIPDNEGNHLVVALSFYEDNEKFETFHIPQEFVELEIADISISKLNENQPLGSSAFFQMCQWLIDKFQQFPNAVFSFICSTDELATNHPNINPEQYRWNLFEFYYKRNLAKLKDMGIESKDIIVGPEGYQTFAKVFYRICHAPIIHLVENHLSNKYS